MKVLILNGAEALRDLAGAVDLALQRELAGRDHVVEQYDLSTLPIPDCLGDFGCWTVTPGVCVQPGPHRDVARALIQSDLVIWLTSITFGGYSSVLKRFLDHCIPLVSPKFAKVDGETHHEPRYERFPSLLVVGLQERPDEASRQVFERLVRRNALNMHAPHFTAPVITREELPALPMLVDRWLDDLWGSEPARAGGEPMALGAREDLPPVRPRSALMLVGSPRGKESVSASLAAHLAGLLAQRGMTVATESLAHHLTRDPGWHALAAAVHEADVVALATPLYVDSLPGLVVEALEAVANRRTAGACRPRFLALVNSGFPEAVHSDTALAICRRFAEEAGLDWIGGLAIGAGGMLAGKPIAELGSRGRNVARALALAADAISSGHRLPDEAQELVRRQVIPAALYRFFGDWGFRRDADRHGTRKHLGDRPYA